MWSSVVMRVVGMSQRRGAAWRFDINSIKQLSSFDRIPFTILL